MEERKVPPAQRGNIDGISPRRPNTDNQTAGNSPAPGSGQTNQGQKPPKDQQTNNPTKKKQPKKSKNLLVIIPAIIIFIGLSALAVYSGLQRNSDNQQANEAGAGQNAGSEASDLIDQTINEIDQLDDQPDTSGEGLSDDRLGL